VGNEFYEQVIFVEHEFSAGVEYQFRSWIGGPGDAAPVLMGYESGHFSLPAFRLEEIDALLCDPGLKSPSVVLLLWLSC
jgi:hypothetical protein